MTPGVTATVLVLSVVAVAAFRRFYRRRRTKYTPRGTAMSDNLPPEYNQPSEQRPFLFGNRWLSFEEARKHFLIVGSTGSGKTVNVKILLKQVLKHQASPKTNVRAMVYDSKTDLLGITAAMMDDGGELPPNLIVMNPFDARCSAWDIARDIEDSTMAADVATILAPAQAHSNNPFFIETAQRLLEGIITAFIENAPGAWTLRDVIQAGTNARRLRAVLESSEETIGLIDFFTPADTFNDVHSTLTGKLLLYKDIAACWDQAREQGTEADGSNSRVISLEEWLDSDRVLVLGNSTRKKSAISQINQLLFAEASKVLLDRPGQGKGETWFFLDELAELGMMDTLGDLMNRGRSKGAAVVLGFQDIGKLDAVYGRDVSRSIVGAAQNVALLHINDSQDDTQRWASSVVGEKQELRMMRSSGNSSSLQPNQYGYQLSTSTSENQSEQYFTEPAVLPSQFGSYDRTTGLPLADPQTGMIGLFRIASRWVRQAFDGKALFEDNSKHNFIGYDPGGGVVDFQPWPTPPKLKNWTTADAERLGIVGLVNVLQAEPKAKGTEQDQESRIASIRRAING